VDSDPAALADVRRNEEPVRIRLDEQRLRVVPREEPERDAAIAVMVVREHGEHAPLADPVGGCAPGDLLDGLGKRETDAAHACEVVR
jgi:hypothetical protein